MLVSPDNGMSGFRYALKNGVRAVEVDVWMTDDFQLVCMHDETIDRTTDGTGDTVDLTASTLESVRLDSDIVVSPAWRQEKIPLFLDVLQEFGGKVLLVAEAKNDSALLPMIDMVEEFGIDPRSVVIQSPTQSLLAQAVARGFPGLMLQEDLSTLDWGDVADDGIQYVASTWSNFNSTYVGLATAAGIKCVGYTVDRRVDRDAVFALGLTAIFSDDPVYLLTSEAITTYDRFPSRMFMPGMIPHTAANRGAFTANGGWEPVSDTSSSFKNSLMGSLCPTPASWVMDFLMRMDAVSADDRWASIFICAGDDSKYIDGLPYAVNGYHCLFRRNGTMGIYPFTANVGVGTPTTVTGTNLTLGADNAMRITVTPTTITLANLTQGHSVQLASTLARGGYLHFGSNNCRVTYKSIRIT